jgi:hypothetical protein
LLAIVSTAFAIPSPFTIPLAGPIKYLAVQQKMH